MACSPAVEPVARGAATAPSEALTLPSIAVCVTSCNQRALLIEAIESVLAQTRPADQIVLVDDASTDGSQEVLAAYRRRHPELISTLGHTENRGVTQTRIDALAAARGDLVCFLDGDDRYLPRKLEVQERLFRDDPLAGIAFANHYRCYEDGRSRELWVESGAPPTGYVLGEVFGRRFPRGVLFRNELVDRRKWLAIGSFDASLPIWEDFDMRIRLASRLRVVWSEEPLSEYRVHPGSLIRSAGIELHLSTLEAIYRKNLPLLDLLAPRQRRRAMRGFRGYLALLASDAALAVLGRRPSASGAARAEALALARRSAAYRWNHRAGLTRLAATLPDPVLGPLLDAARDAARSARRARRALRRASPR